MAPRYQPSVPPEGAHYDSPMADAAFEQPGGDSPQQVSDAFAAALAQGDVDAAVALWAEDASILTANGERLHGREAVASALRTLAGNGTAVRIELLRTILADNAALGLGYLTLSGTGPDGEPFSQRSSSAVIYSRGSDGRWRIAIDSPWGLPSPDAAEPDGQPAAEAVDGEPGGRG